MCVYVCCLSVCVLKFLAALIIQFRDLRPLGLKTLRVSGFEFLGVKFDFFNYIQILVENGRKKMHHKVMPCNSRVVPLLFFEFGRNCETYGDIIFQVKIS